MTYNQVKHTIINIAPLPISICDIVIQYIGFPKFTCVFTSHVNIDIHNLPFDEGILKNMIIQFIENMANTNSYVKNSKHNFLLYLDKEITCKKRQRQTMDIIKKETTMYNHVLCPKIYALYRLYDSDKYVEYVFEVDSNYINLIPNRYKTPKKYLHSFNYDHSNIQYIPKSIITPEICQTAFTTNMETFKYIPRKHITQEMCTIVVKYFPQYLLKEIPSKFITTAMCKNLAMRRNKLEILSYDSESD